MPSAATRAAAPPVPAAATPAPLPAGVPDWGHMLQSCVATGMDMQQILLVLLLAQASASQSQLVAGLVNQKKKRKKKGQGGEAASDNSGSSSDADLMEKLKNDGLKAIRNVHRLHRRIRRHPVPSPH